MVSTSLLAWIDTLGAEESAAGVPPAFTDAPPVIAADPAETKSPAIVDEIVSDLLEEIGTLGMAVVLRDNRPALVRNGLAVPQDIVDRLRLHRDAVVYRLQSMKPRPAAARYSTESIEPNPEGGPICRPDLPWVEVGALSHTPPSWEDYEGKPVPDDAKCCCCRGRNWWREAVSPAGWRCSTCHPPPPGREIFSQTTLPMECAGMTRND